MAFINNGTTVVSFAEYDDVVQIDSRLFDSNEGLTVELVEDILIRSTERILALMKASDWWRSYYSNQSGNPSVTVSEIPDLDIDLIIGRSNDFTDLCVYYGLYNYILPKVADFGGEEEDAEYGKISYYQNKQSQLFTELAEDGDWYDFDGDGTITPEEKQPTLVNLKRVR